MEGGGGERGEGILLDVGENMRDCLMGSESARRNGVLVTDLDTWISALLGVSMDWRGREREGERERECV